MINWKKASVKPPLDKPLLLWYQGARHPVFGAALSQYKSSRLKYMFSSSQARGVVYTHWATMNNPRGKSVTYGEVK